MTCLQVRDTLVRFAFLCKDSV